jgi:hypothetical protein
VGPKAKSDETLSIRRHLLGGAIVALTLTCGIGGWAATTELPGAVIASGSVVVVGPCAASPWASRKIAEGAYRWRELAKRVESRWCERFGRPPFRLAHADLAVQTLLGQGLRGSRRSAVPG